MSGRSRWRMTLMALILSLLTTAVSSSPDGRISFRVTTIEELAGQRNVISDAFIHGPPGTDFRILLESDRFEMDARFLTDQIGSDRLRVRAHLKTRRLFGYSHNDLPLYEEDKQDPVIELGPDEALVLLPFGRGDSDERLKIEIVPEFGTSMATGDSPQLLEIDLLEPAPGGIVRIQAEKIPHHYTVEASMLRDGVELARGNGQFLLEERGALELLSVAGGLDDSTYLLALTVDGFTRSRPRDRVSVRFDLDRTAGGEVMSLAREWAGITSVERTMSYDVPSGLELRLRIRVAEDRQTWR